MDVATGSQRSRVGRLLLLALFAAVVWCAFTLMSATSSASADENDHGSGLLGTVGSVVNGVGNVVTETTDAAEQVVTKTVHVVAPAAQPILEPAVEPILEPVTAPVAAPVIPVVEKVVGTTDRVVAGVDATVVTVVDEATAAVSHVASSGIVTDVVSPVTELVTDLPVVGAVVEAAGVGDALTSIADGVDATVGELVGIAPAAGSIIPGLPVGAVDAVTDSIDPPTVAPITVPLPVAAHIVAALTPAPAAVPPARASDVAVADATRTSVSRTVSPHSATAADLTAVLSEGAVTHTAVAVSSSDERDRSAGGLPGSLAGGQATIGGSAAGVGAPAAGTADANAWGAASGFSFFRVHTDDALPGSPVFDTDVAPD